jgi:hypothetical protein
MYSNRRADGVLLEAMIKADPKNDLIPKLVRGLLDNRVKVPGQTRRRTFHPAGYGQILQRVRKGHA